jgi:hypothetical protein
VGSVSEGRSKAEGRRHKKRRRCASLLLTCPYAITGRGTRGRCSDRVPVLGLGPERTATGNGGYRGIGIWGLAIAGFGLAGDVRWLGLLLLAIAGAGDMVSAIFRNTILQLSIPDSLRGRMSAFQMMIVTSGPRLGDLEAGAIAAVAGPIFSVDLAGPHALLVLRC